MARVSRLAGRAPIAIQIIMLARSNAPDVPSLPMKQQVLPRGAIPRRARLPAMPLFQVPNPTLDRIPVRIWEPAEISPAKHENRSAGNVDPKPRWQPNTDLLQDLPSGRPGMADPGAVQPRPGESGREGGAQGDHGQPARSRSAARRTVTNKIYTWNCEYCGEAFPTDRWDQRYCNRTHREYAYRERKRQKAQTVDALGVNKNRPQSL